MVALEKALATVRDRKPSFTAALVAAAAAYYILSRLGVWPLAFLFARRKKSGGIATASSDVFSKTYDYIVVGAGSAGCVLANRLSEDPGVTVLLIEAGGNAMKDPNVNTPLLFSKTQHTPADWIDHTIRQPHTRNRIHYWPRGRLLGGCSATNAMIYVRGNPADFDRWEREHGCVGWNFNAVLPYFAKSEGVKINGEEIDERFHGRNGPLAVSRSTGGRVAKTSELFVEACQRLGMGRSERYLRDKEGRMRGVDYNGEDQYGAAISQVLTAPPKVTVHKGVRSDTANAFLAPLVDPSSPHFRPNLTVLTNVLVTRVTTSPTSTGALLATGVAVRPLDPRGRPLRPSTDRLLRARREVHISCGAVQSPKLLQLSGLGPRNLLTRHGIPVLRDLPGVGANLRDHLCASAGRQDLTGSVYTDAPGKVVKALWEYATRKEGMLSCGGVEAFAFLNARRGSEEERNGQPDIQLHLISISVGGSIANKLKHDTIEPGPVDPQRPDAHDPLASRASFLRTTQSRNVPGPFMVIAPTLLHPRSTGTVTIASADPLVAPVIDPNYLADEDDVTVMVEGFRAARAVFEEIDRCVPGALGLENRDPELVAECMRVLGCGEEEAAKSDLYLRELIRRTAVTLYHPVGTCKMGPASDPMSVVDPTTLKVHGVSNLRVADASVLPTLTSGNTNAPAILVGEICADMVKGRWRAEKGAGVLGHRDSGVEA
ncbi:hypothetical protein HDU96_002085 [Phlyctochytrium bullatum]|nr:hypothetical protein HDU96_002085 [Phlyctochytrium bullatum]